MVALERPAGVAGIVISPSDGTGNVGYASSQFVIKVIRYRQRFWTRTQETTGAGDTKGPVIENNEHVYGRFSVVGYMVANKEVGIQYLKDQTTTVWTIGFRYGANVEFPDDSGNDATFVMESIDLNYDNTSTVVGVAMSGIFTDWDFATAGQDIG